MFFLIFFLITCFTHLYIKNKNYLNFYRNSLYILTETLYMFSIKFFIYYLIFHITIKLFIYYLIFCISICISIKLFIYYLIFCILIKLFIYYLIFYIPIKLFCISIKIFIYYLNFKKNKKNFLSGYNINGAYKLKRLKSNNGRIERYY